MNLESAEAPLDIDDEIAELRRYLWRARGRQSRRAGTFLLILSAAFFVLAYATRYIVFEATSIASFLLGTILVFTSLEPYMKTRTANEAIYSSLRILEDFLNRLDARGKAVYIPPEPEQNQGRVFIFAPGHSKLPNLKKLTDENEMIYEEGVLVPSLGNSLIKLYEEDLGDIRKMDFEYLQEWLPRVLVSGLKLAEKVEITRLGNEVKVEITGTVFNQLCQQRENIKTVCETLGCPLESSIAEALAKNTERLVYKVESRHDPQATKTTTRYVLGASVDVFEPGKPEAPT